MADYDILNPLNLANLPIGTRFLNESVGGSGGNGDFFLIDARNATDAIDIRLISDSGDRLNSLGLRVYQSDTTNILEGEFRNLSSLTTGTSNEFTSLPPGESYLVRVHYELASFIPGPANYRLEWSDFRGENSSQDDYYEQNDSLPTAYDLTNDENKWLSNINGLGIQADEDWYEIKINSGFERLVAELDFTHTDGDINLAVYDVNGNRINESDSNTDDEVIDTVLPEAGTYFLKVYEGDQGNPYDLRWDSLKSNNSGGGEVASINLADLDGRDGFVINGIELGDFSGSSVSSAGDFNGDGFDDILIGAYHANPNGKRRAGETYVVWGHNQGFNSSLNLSSLNGRNGWVIKGIDIDDISGNSVSTAGDFNGDGFDDILIGANEAAPNGNSRAGETYLIFGNTSSFNSSFDPRLLDGLNGFVINGSSGDGSGREVSTAGDFNGDGFDDIIIGAYNNNRSNAGETYLLFGSSRSNPSLNLSSLNGRNGFVINGIDAYDHSSRSLSSAGDVNGDGFDDIIIGAFSADPNGQSAAGETYIVFGSNQGFNPSLNLSNLNGRNGFVINGIAPSDYSGLSVSGAGDINGDGFDDIIIGALNADPNGRGGAGETYVVFGSNQGFNSSFNLSNLNGRNGFAINGIDASDSSGRSVSNAGDFNGDGFDDILIGADDASPNGKSEAGETYLIFGKADGFNASFELDSLDGSNGLSFNGISIRDHSGWSVSGAGDINNDGFDDILIGANDADANGNINSGETYVIFGRSSDSNSGNSNNSSIRPNIIWRNNLDGTNVLWEMDDTQILQGRPLPVLGTEWKLKATADFNNDGQSDLFWRNINSGENVIWYMNDTNKVGETILPTLGLEWELGTTGDFNNDGHEDLMWRHSTAGINTAWYLNHGQVQGAQALRSLSNEWQLATSGDFNNDGNEDFIWRHLGAGTNVFWYTGGNLNLIGGEVFNQLPDMTWQITGSADMDRDGHDDLLWRNSHSGDNVIWHMHNNAIRDGGLFSTLPGRHWQMVV